MKRDAAKRQRLRAYSAQLKATLALTLVRSTTPCGLHGKGKHVVLCWAHAGVMLGAGCLRSGGCRCRVGGTLLAQPVHLLLFRGSRSAGSSAHTTSFWGLVMGFVFVSTPHVGRGCSNRGVPRNWPSHRCRQRGGHAWRATSAVHVPPATLRRRHVHGRLACPQP